MFTQPFFKLNITKLATLTTVLLNFWLNSMLKCSEKFGHSFKSQAEITGTNKQWEPTLMSVENIRVHV